MPGKSGSLICPAAGATEPGGDPVNTGILGAVGCENDKVLFSTDMCVFDATKGCLCSLQTGFKRSIPYPR